jgi:hypothetical protein
MTNHTVGELLDRAHAVLPAGTLGNMATDIVIAKGHAGRVWDTNGREYC